MNIYFFKNIRSELFHSTKVVQLVNLIHFFDESWIMQLHCCSSSDIYASLVSLQSRRIQSEKNDNVFKEHLATKSLTSLIPDVALDMTESNIKELRITEAKTGCNKQENHAIYDWSRESAEEYEQLQQPTTDEHIYTGHIPPVMRDILREMPSGMTVEDILRTCVDDQLPQCQSDNEDPEENSNYL